MAEVIDLRRLGLLAVTLAGVSPAGAAEPPSPCSEEPPGEARGQLALAPCLETEGFEDLGDEAEQSRRELELRVQVLEEALLQSQKPAALEPVVRFGGYADFGFFVPLGDGIGVVRAVSGQVSDLQGRFAWVFLGDLLSTAVNSRGEAASLGQLPGVERFDSIDSEGAASFILNELNLSANVSLSESLFFLGSVNFVPRSGTEFSIGDFLDVDLAELEWAIFDAPKTSVFVGKIAPSVGIEYKHRKSNDRFGITPTLVGRYTTGTQLGLKVRSRLFDEWLILSLALTNGSSVVEQFHFSREVDSNDGKTLSGRAALRVPMARVLDQGVGELELGVSGEWGPQDRAFDSDSALWLLGFDIEYARDAWSIRAEGFLGEAPGRSTDRAYALDLRGSGYLEVNWLLIPALGILGRAEIRDALVSLGNERIYVSQSVRLVLGARAVFTSYLALKAEYLFNLEYGDVPSFQNDVLTTSLVLSY